jgi:hypothetical protein
MVLFKEIKGSVGRDARIRTIGFNNSIEINSNVSIFN